MAKSVGLKDYNSRRVRSVALHIQEAVDPADLVKFMTTVIFAGVDPIGGGALPWKDRWQAFELFMAYGYGRPVSQTELINEVLSVLTDENAGKPLVPGLATMSLEEIRQKRATLQAILSVHQQELPPPSES